MYKTFLVVVVVLLVGQTYSQNLYLRGSYVKPWITYKESGSFLNSGWKSSFNFGIGVQLKVSKKLQLLPELSFVQKGNSFSYQMEDADISIYYADFALLGKFNFDRVTGLYLLAGPYLGIGLFGSCRLNVYPGTERVVFNGTPNTSNDTQFYAEIDHRLESGIQAGIGYQLTKSIGVDLRYCHGLTKLYSLQDRLGWSTGANRVENARNRMLQIGLIWVIKTKPRSE